MSKRKLVLSVVTAFFIIILFGIVIIEPAEILSRIKQNSEELKGGFSDNVVYDGNHYKLLHPIGEKNNTLYISLPDLEAITSLKTAKKENQLTIRYKDKRLIYDNGFIQKCSQTKDELCGYERINDTIYIPDVSVERLGFQIGFFYDKQTNTVSIKSPEEQAKKPQDQELGLTIYVHKDNVPAEKYEPRSGIYPGGYVLQDEFIDASMNTFNKLTGKTHASYFKYVGYGKPFPKDWAEEVIAAGGFPQVAWEPNNGLDEVKDDEYLRQFAKDAGELNVPILLRYASEMNGTWTFYSGHSEQYIEKWKLVHDVMEKEAPNVMMLWNVFTMPEAAIDDFYPGDEYVDYVGVNIYNVFYHNDKIEEKSDFEDPLRLLDYVYNTYSHKKPIVIGEYGATNYTVTDGKHHDNFAVEKITRMYKYLPELYPRVKFVYYFDVNNLVNAPEGRKINNYAITEKKSILNAYAANVKADQYLSKIEVKPAESEVYSYRDFFFYCDGELYVDYKFVRDYLNMDVKEDRGKSMKVTYNGKSIEVNQENLKIDKAAFFEKREIKGLPLGEILTAFEVENKLIDGDLHIQITN
ncbi:glycosyl hydrolase family 26 [Cytobacillus firmus]|uniref:Glycosyl hydrolase family 26 n=2 Tax=Cytobacillus TaxID=2675230 RepID=A0A366JXY5_CYTFI|nr:MULTISPECIES: glycosyl hydrolase [Cytobacillus]RBP94379.1 glycosyl hydrolase family 26 [Cytobacillus firmus]TDX43126.1 glycosyl hydrolase family 26 [Cytobacillus oceanisediminis]